MISPLSVSPPLLSQHLFSLVRAHQQLPVDQQQLHQQLHVGQQQLHQQLQHLIGIVRAVSLKKK